MKKIKTILHLIILSTFLKVDNIFAIFGEEKINSGLVGDQNTVDITIQRYVENAQFFLYLGVVLFGIYGGFLIFTAGGDDEKPKKGKAIIIQAIIGLIIIYLAGPIVELLIGTNGIFS